MTTQEEEEAVIAATEKLLDPPPDPFVKLLTPEGKRRLGESMANPIRDRLREASYSRKVFSIKGS